MTATLSLADIARLARVQRPVVSMWRQRAVPGAPFPTPRADGRFSAGEVLSYLSATGRGNNPDPELTSDLTVASSSATDPSDRGDLLTLLAARAVLGADSLAETDVEDLLDDVEALDPDDEWLFSEVEGSDVERLARTADAVADNSFSPAQAYEQLLAADPDPSGLTAPLVDLLAELTAALLGEDSKLVDVAGTATGTALRLAADESLTPPAILLARDLPSDRATARRTPLRATLRRYRVHRCEVGTVAMEDDWDLPAGSVILARVPDHTDPARADPAQSDPDHTDSAHTDSVQAAPATAEAFGLIDDLTLQMGPGTTALVLGPASILIDELPDALVGQRDAFLRRGLVRAAVRLPAGLLRGGGGEHLALWLLAEGDSRHLWAGDLSGRSLDAATSQQLLDDVVAVARSERQRAFSILHRAEAAKVIALSQSLVALDVSPADPLPVSAADDAARMAELLALLAEPMPDPLSGLRPEASDAGGGGHGSALSATLGDLARKRLVRIISGYRLPRLPAGTLQMWTAEAVATHLPAGVDLLALTTAIPGAALTAPDDLVFTSTGTPHAVVDAGGGSVVAYPARILRVSPTASCSPRAIAATINELRPGTGIGKWRSWQVPLVSGSRREVEDVMTRIQAWEDQTRTRLAQIGELRRLATRSVTSGAVRFAAAACTHPEPAPVDEKGQ
ncbi:hypothetical protein [Acidipropionibacterium jensenii]|uniref:hypothetical protein n=1 Tax=Acidipropionibacterium jensenii TaxID=1749 RepID=UPI00264792A3|nr:hypothetical protein [Acidipropionibacterium jensenii]MDN6556209.1 hypothetical protein [Acidipropionibacterium acidipropionici]MDN6761405.1 hypothetical protein [Acidipropionibacterium jensenii]